MNEICTSKEKNKNIGIVLFSSRKYLFALGTFIINLQQHISYDGLIIYHEGFTDSEIEAVHKVEPKSKLVKYDVEELSKEFGIDENIIRLYDIDRFSILPAIKFKIFQYLDEFPTVMFFDLDMILLGDMDDVLEKDFDIAWRIDATQTIKHKLNRFGVSDEFIKEIGMYDTYNETETPNAGFFVLKRTFDYRKVYEECVNYLRNYSFKHPFQIDEIIFGYIASVMKLNVYCVDDKVYNVFPDSVNIKSKLIHFLGTYKPWNNQMVQAFFLDWRRCYEKYVALTNMPSDEVIIFNNISECLLQSHYRDTWRHLFNELNFIYPSQLEIMPELSAHKLEFSYHGIAIYRIDIEWLLMGCRCFLWIDKKNGNVPVKQMQEKTRMLSIDNGAFVTYLEDENGFGLRTVDGLIHDMPDYFHRLYDLTEELREISHISTGQISTYHGTRLYVNVEKRTLIHAESGNGAELYVAVKGGKCALFINLSGMNVYLKSIENDGTVILTTQQTYFSCAHNSDQSIYIEVTDGSILSANVDGKITLRHWNREWEHFFVHSLGNIIE